MRWPDPYDGTTSIVDPCAGDGAAVATLRRLLYEAACERFARETRYGYAMPVIRACELEAVRAEALARKLTAYRDVTYHGDAFHLRRTCGYATLLYLNPPYDVDREHKRLEHRFLTRFADHLLPGKGFLFFLVPCHALAASADFLARNFHDLRCWRLPEPHFEVFKQVLLVGRRAARPIHGAPHANAVRRWALDPSSLPLLEERCSDPYEVEPAGDDERLSYAIRYQLEDLDTSALLAHLKPLDDPQIGFDRGARQLLGVPTPTAVPPKPTHIAIALSCGMFNGKRLEPNDPSRHPPILVKGVFRRERTEVAEKRNAEGERTGVVAVERPQLILTILRLDTFDFHTLLDGTLPHGGDNPSLWTAADLITFYDRSLARVMTEQFPPLHDPKDEAARIALPALPRRPYRAQDHAIQACLKLIAQGRNPNLVAEVGTGKSTMSLYVMAALSPQRLPRTRRELRKLGLDARALPRVRRTLILCPPHLLTSWTNEAKAVVPDARVKILRRPADLEADAEIYVLSREKAKLGHPWKGLPQHPRLDARLKPGRDLARASLAGICPRCGERIQTDASSNARRRLRCSHVPRLPAGLYARHARDLAVLLA
ncbi:MAG: hypothetical protein D6696_00560, partial [Acidobacteria bacterium]